MIQDKLWVKKRNASGDIPPFRICRLLNDKTLTLATAATDALIAVADTQGYVAASTNNRYKEVALDAVFAGIAPVEYGATIAIGQPLTSDSIGRAIPVTPSTIGNGVRIVGYAAEAGVLGDIGSVIVEPACTPFTSPIGFTTITNITTAGPATYTAAQLLGGLITRNTSGAGRTDTTPTAALLVAAVPAAAVGTSFEFVIINTAGAAETLTVAGGTGVTISGTATIAQNNQKRWRAVFTNVGTGTEAVTIYSLGTVVT